MKKLIAPLIIVLSSITGYTQSIDGLDPQSILMMQQMSTMADEQLINFDAKTGSLNKEQEVSERKMGDGFMDFDTVPRTPSVNVDVIPGITLPVFGRNLFTSKNLNFAPNLNIGTPSSYILTAGDNVRLNLWGATESEYKLQVSPDGYIVVSDVGLIYIGGKSIKEAQNIIKSRLVKSFEGVASGEISVNLSLGDIGTITVNVAGEAKVPGTYTVPSLATLFNVLYLAGGVNTIGSLRDIKLYRAGKLISTLDVYDYLLNGDVMINKLLEDNDLIVIEPYQNLIQISGSVKRPMTYELKDGEKLEKLIEYSGGFDGLAFSDNLNIIRSATGKDKQIFTVDKAGYPYFVMMDRDIVTISYVENKFQNRIYIEGAVKKSGYYELSDKISTVKELISVAQGFEDDVYKGRAFVRRIMPDSTFLLIAFNIDDLYNFDNDIELQKEDKVTIFSKQYFRYKQTIEVLGEVNKPLVINYATNMTLFDVVTMAGGFTPAASYAKLEVARRYVDPQSTQVPLVITDLFSFKINGDLELTDNSKSFALKPFDVITVRKSPGYYSQMPVVLMGEVNFDGQHMLSNTKTTISKIIKQAGGVTSNAYVKGAYLKRKKTTFDIDRERVLQSIISKGVTNIYNYTDPKSDTVSVIGDGVGDYYSVGIDLPKALKYPGSIHDIVLRKDDIIVIPTINNTVRITGAVYYPNTVTYQKHKKMRHYIKQAGGYTKDARRKLFIVYQNGMVSSRYGTIDPGCEIVVPYKPPRVPMGPQGWTALGTSVLSMAAMVTSLLVSVNVL